MQISESSAELFVDEVPAQASGWQAIPARSGIEAVLAGWGTLAARAEVEPLAGPDWTATALASFFQTSPGLELQVLGDQRLHAVIPLQRSDGTVRIWRSLLNQHYPYFPAALDDQAAEQMTPLLQLLLRDADVLELERVHRDGLLCRSLKSAAEVMGFPVVEEPDGGEAFIDLDRPWPELQRALPAELVRSAPGQLRDLRDGGELEFRVHHGGPELIELLDECFALEARALSGRDGEAISSRPQTLRFYRQLAQRASRTGRFALYLLSLDARIIAFAYCLRGPQRIEQLRTAGDPDQPACNPEKLLQLMLLEHESRHGHRGRLCLGLAGPGNLDCATRVRPLCRLQIFGHSLRAQAYYLAGSRARTILKAALRSQPRLAGHLRDLIAGARKLQARRSDLDAQRREPARALGVGPVSADARGRERDQSSSGRPVSNLT